MGGQFVADIATLMEPDMGVRLRAGGQTGEAVTGEGVWGSWLHGESRPARQDGLPDPQLHTHNLWFNQTWHDGRCFAADMGEIEEAEGGPKTAHGDAAAHIDLAVADFRHRAQGPGQEQLDAAKQLPVIEAAAIAQVQLHRQLPPRQREVMSWWGNAQAYRLTSWQSDFWVGGRWRAEGASLHGEGFVVEGEFLEIDPPRRLVTGSLYARVRNPIYLGATLVLLGEAVVWQSLALLVYAAASWLAWHLFVVALFKSPMFYCNRSTLGKPIPLKRGV